MHTAPVHHRAREAARRARDREHLAAQRPEERTELLLEAAGDWHVAGDLDRADRLYRELISEDGGTADEVRAHYVGFLVDIGQEEQARTVLDELWERRPDDPWCYEIAGEALEAVGDTESALRWFTEGVLRCYPGELTVERVGRNPGLLDLLAGRARVRRATGLPADEWDVLEEQGREEMLAELAESDEIATGPVAEIALFWPPGELEELLHRWPETYPGLARAPDPASVHRAQVEHDLRRSRSPHTYVAIGSVEQYRAFVQDRGQEPTDPRARAGYVEELARLGALVRWPPGRNEPCWCGSGGKYKKCCGIPGAPT